MTHKNLSDTHLYRRGQKVHSNYDLLSGERCSLYYRKFAVLVTWRTNVTREKIKSKHGHFGPENCLIKRERRNKIGEEAEVDYTYFGFTTTSVEFSPNDDLNDLMAQNKGQTPLVGVS